MAKQNKKQKFKWINCPNCGRKFYKSYTNYRVEIMCHSCKGVYLIWQNDNENCHEEIQSPKRFGPSEFK